MLIENASTEQLQTLLAELENDHEAFRASNLQLDLTRGKPSSEQLNLSNSLDGILEGNYSSKEGTDLRNYGGLDGIPEAKALLAPILDVEPHLLFVGGNSSLTLMHYVMWFAMHLGISENAKPWSHSSGKIKFLCPVPGYDRHFSICEQLGIEMINVPLTGHGPDMGMVEDLVTNDPHIKGIWCVPRFSNPTGETYNDETVARIANLSQIAGKDFIVMWDNAYAVHSLATNEEETASSLASIINFAIKAGTESSIFQFGSTSKISFAGAGIGFMSSSEENLAGFRKHFGIAAIGPDKINQLRHVKLLKDKNGLKQHMQQHARIIKAKFDRVDQLLEQHLGSNNIGSWSKPLGGYFISFNSLPGLASEIISLAKEAGVKLTPAGSTYPYKKDSKNSNIRLAPTYPDMEELEKAIEVFINCVKIASVRHRLQNQLKTQTVL